MEEPKNEKKIKVKTKKNILYLLLAIPMTIGLSISCLNEYDQIQQKKESDVMSSIKSKQLYQKNNILIMNTLNELNLNDKTIELNKLSNYMTNDGFNDFLNQLKGLNLNIKDKKLSLTTTYDKNKILFNSSHKQKADISENYTVPINIELKDQNGKVIKSVNELMNINLLTHIENGKFYALVNKIELPQKLKD